MCSNYPGCYQTLTWSETIVVRELAERGLENFWRTCSEVCAVQYCSIRMAIPLFINRTYFLGTGLFDEDDPPNPGQRVANKGIQNNTLRRKTASSTLARLRMMKRGAAERAFYCALYRSVINHDLVTGVVRSVPRVEGYLGAPRHSLPFRAVVVARPIPCTSVV